MIPAYHNKHSNEFLHYTLRLAEVRREKGLSQWGLAVRTYHQGEAVTPGTISKLERQVRPARARTVRALGKALGVRPWLLIDRPSTAQEEAGWAAIAAHLQAMEEAAAHVVMSEAARNITAESGAHPRTRMEVSA